ncbi:rhamnogalacturonan acetylesterase [Sphingomonas psychrotolerans]|uniref:Rhamnogalacturonan acetylesterase n=1 Tax=Sphingomonas psychrotolerans TaxID=1327635 RepID=A0A2K8MHE2_9SPHN|nr:rhamnogalacturonan acetylesterase [Sphingomonas psychrotolerans]ATY32404.1 rhamnogalacturonan acetylesterase [Sphingomonas psychrotolerans]
MLLAAMLIATSPVLRFDLEPPKRATGRLVVAADKPYETGGYGYEPQRRGKGFLFSAAVPEGNYRVTVRLGGRVTVKAESRRLMLRDVTTEPGRYVTASFVVNVRNAQLAPPPANAPGGSQVKLKSREAGSYTWDDKLTLEFLGDPRVASIDIEPVTLPTVFLAGDSTVTDQRAEPAASWGQMLTALFEPNVAIANHAESGETLKSFVTELRFDKLLSQIKAGDWLLIQFGHNDQKAQWPQTYADPDLTYPAWLRTYIAEARRRGAHPVLVTSPERRNYDGSKVRRTLAEYGEAARKVAREEKVPLLDLQEQTVMLHEALGEAKAASLFNDGGKDRTHHNNPGAWFLARAVAAEIATQVPDLAVHLRPSARSFDPANPDLTEGAIAPSLAESNVRPAGS